jgi:hypothetical protein
MENKEKKTSVSEKGSVLVKSSVRGKNSMKKEEKSNNIWPK